MSVHSITVAKTSFTSCTSLPRTALHCGSRLLAAASLIAFVPAEAAERSGEQLVADVCVICHGSGLHGAPKIGDKQAWGKLAARGLTNLTSSAMLGVRKMPAHGGSIDASDLEIKRAITYMVNQSGGKWVEPVGKSTIPVSRTPLPERSGQYIVETQCGKCHQSGENGAPKVGDRAAWVERLKRGLDAVVLSALNGHGPMPAKGGLADITVNEIRSAIVYMFNPASASMVVPAPNPVAPQSLHHRIVGSTEMFFGIVPAESIRATRSGRDKTFSPDAPQGANYYHINLSLRDRITQVPLTNAKVEARVEDPAMRGESRTLEMTVINNAVSYGGFFRLPSKGRYFINVTVERPNTTPDVEARFEFTRG